MPPDLTTLADNAMVPEVGVALGSGVGVRVAVRVGVGVKVAVIVRVGVAVGVAVAGAGVADDCGVEVGAGAPVRRATAACARTRP